MERLERNTVPQHKGNLHLGPGPQPVGHQHAVSQATLAETYRQAQQEKTGKDSAKMLLPSLPWSWLLANCPRPKDACFQDSRSFLKFPACPSHVQAQPGCHLGYAMSQRYVGDTNQLYYFPKFVKISCKTGFS